MMKNKESGITLIILVVTIIVMVILTGTVVILATDDNGFFVIKDKTENDYVNQVEKTEKEVNAIKSNWINVLNHKGIDNVISNSIS